MKDKKISIAIGKSGSGKSFLVNRLIRDKKRVVVFDTMAEYENVVTFTDRDKFLAFWQKHYRGNYRIAYQPERNPAFEIDDIAELVYLCGNVCFVIEEVTAFTTPNYISDQLAHCIQRGRHKNIEIIGTTQRPYGLHRLLTSQCRDIYTFNTNEPRDIAYLRDLLGSDIEAKLKSLAKYQFVHWQDGRDVLTIEKKGTDHEPTENATTGTGQPPDCSGVGTGGPERREQEHDHQGNLDESGKLEQ